MTAFPVYGIDPDRTQPAEAPVEAIRRRLDGRYPVDPFGGDPMLQDLVAPWFAPFVRLEVEGAEHLPRRGPALLVANRGLGVAEPTVLATAVRRAIGRRVRVVGAPELPLLGDLVRKLGGIMSYPEDLAALLRAGHVAALPLGPTWFRNGAGTPPIRLLVAALGYPVIPVAIKPGGPLHLALRPWRVVVGAPLEDLAVQGSGDPLAAAELAEAARDGVQRLLEDA
jgi:1-acyl-sn-glycerol-3-phosphate acyltransferase